LVDYQPVTSRSALPLFRLKPARGLVILTPASSSALNLSSAVPLPAAIIAPEMDAPHAGIQTQKSPEIIEASFELTEIRQLKLTAIGRLPTSNFT